MGSKAPKIIELMGKEKKGQRRKTHQAVISAFKPDSDPSGETSSRKGKKK